MKTNVGMDLIPYLRAVFKYKRCIEIYKETAQQTTKRQKQTTVLLTLEPLNKGHIGTALDIRFFVLLRKAVHFLQMYCRYAKTSIWDYKKCILNGGELYCVLYRECPLLEVPL